MNNKINTNKLTKENIKEIKLDEIIIEKRIREFNSDIIPPLSDSIKENGLLHPITINEENILICGYHRYMAHKSLKYKTILCNVVVAKDEDTRKEMEIDENMVRLELHYFDLAEQLKMKKSLYEKKHPETILGATGKGRKKETKSFIDDITEQLKKSKSSVYNLLNIYNTLNKEDRDIIKELNIPQTDVKSIIKMDEDYRKEIFNTIRKHNLDVKKSIKYLKNQKNHINLKYIERPADDKFVNCIQVGDAIETIKNIPNDTKYDCLFIDINEYSKNEEEQLHKIDDFLTNVDRLLYDESLLVFFSNEKIDSELEIKLINKFKIVERLFTNTTIRGKDSIFIRRYSTVYVCRNFVNNKEICLGENYFQSKNIFIGSIVENMKIKNMKILDVYINSSDTLNICLLNKFNYFGICADMNTYANLEKVIDLTPYINDDFINYCTSFNIEEVSILKNNIFTFNLANNKVFLLKMDDKINYDFNPVKLNKDTINKILNLCSSDKDFKIWAYDNQIILICNKKRHTFENTYKNDLKKENLEIFYGQFNSDISNKERIDFSINDINSDIFDIYQLSNNGKYNYYIGNSKSIKNLQVLIRELIEK